MKAHIKTFNKYKYLLKNLIIKDVKLKYRRSLLGILWSVLNPLLMMIIISAVFSGIFKIKVENFPLYYLTGSNLFSFLAESTSCSMMSILNSSNLIKKVYIPKYIFPLEKCLFSLINFLFSMIAVIIMFIIFNYHFTWTALLIPIPIICILIFSIGLGLILSALSVFFRDIIHLYSVLLMAWNYFTPIMYPFDILSDSIKSIMNFNPMYHYVKYFRDILMYNTIPSLNANLICVGFSVMALIIGIIFFKSKQDKFILYI